MSEMRRCVRIRFKAKCALNHNNISYIGQMENLSATGALLSFDDGVVIPNEDICTLMIYLENETSPIKLSVSVVHSNFTMVGVKFVPGDTETDDKIHNMIRCLLGGGK